MEDGNVFLRAGTKFHAGPGLIGYREWGVRGAPAGESDTGILKEGTGKVPPF